MSSNNYGEKNLQIRIPIEIIPEEVGINEAIKDTKKRIQEGKGEEFRRNGIFDIYNRNDDQASPKGREQAVPSESNNPLTTLKRTTGKSGLLQGLAPYKPSYMKTALTGTAQVPQGGQAPFDKDSFKKKPEMFRNPYPVQEEAGLLEKIIGRALGSPQQAQQAFSMLKSPAKLIKFIGPVAGPLFAGLIAVELTKKIVRELTRKGSIYDRTFKNVIDNRNEALRTREQQQRILVGFGDTSQLITTNVSGSTNPRDAYNTYTEFNRNQAELEEKFAIRNDSGYD